MNEYRKILEDFRHHYFIKHGIRLDDEILFFFIRINEMQNDLKHEIRSVPKITFSSGWDYFLYGVGKTFFPAVILCILAVLLYLIKH
jgi:hypothetical protein